MRNRAVVMTASVGFVLCSAALSGCGGGTGAAEAPPASGAGQSQPVSGGAQSDPVPVPGEVVNGVAKDEATWSTPLAVYFGVDTNDLRSHAQSVVTATCMHENGYADFRENYDSTAPRPRTTAPDGVGRLFNEELAAQYGYRNAPNPQYLIEADVEAAGGGGLYENASPEFKDQWYACLDRATAEVNEGESPQRLPTGDGPDQATLDSIQSQLNRFHIDTTGPQLQADAAAWRQCMAPLGIADLPDRPWEAGSMRMPDSLRKSGTGAPRGSPPPMRSKSPRTTPSAAGAPGGPTTSTTRPGTSPCSSTTSTAPNWTPCWRSTPPARPTTARSSPRTAEHPANRGPQGSTAILAPARTAPEPSGGAGAPPAAAQ